MFCKTRLTPFYEISRTPSIELLLLVLIQMLKWDIKGSSGMCHPGNGRAIDMIYWNIQIDSHRWKIAVFVVAPSKYMENSQKKVN